MEQIITKEIAEKLMETKGKVRGINIKADGDFVLREKGEDGLKLLEKKLEELDCPIKYREIKPMIFYPLGWRFISFLAIKEVFNFSKEKIFEMGKYSSIVPRMIRLLLGYFTVPQKIFIKEAPKSWRKNFTVGELIPVEFSKERKIFIVRVKDFDLHPLYCHFLCGCFTSGLKVVVKASKITVEETKCTFRGDKYHEFLVKW